MPKSATKASAVKRLKKDSNDKDGVAHWLEENVICY